MYRVRAPLSITLVAVAAGLAACGPGVKQVTVTPATAVLVAKDATLLLTGAPLDAEGTTVINALTLVTWLSSDPAVVSVESGKIVAHKSGEVTITAAVGEVKGSAKVTVSIPSKIKLAPAALILMGVGKTSTLTVEVADELGKPVKNADVPVIWSTSDGNVAVVEDGKVKALGAGESVITATFKSAKGDARVTVKLPAVAKIELTPNDGEGGPNGKVQLKATPYDEAGAPILGYFASWASANEKIAKVATDGEVTLVKKGKVKIKATISGVSAETEVTVK